MNSLFEMLINVRGVRRIFVVKCVRCVYMYMCIYTTTEDNVTTENLGYS